MRSKVFISIFVGLMVAVFGLLGWRLFHLQHISADTYKEDLDRQQRSVILQYPQRGFIVDSRSNILAASSKIDTVFVEPRLLENIDAVKEVSIKLQEALGIGAHELCRIIATSANPGYVMIKENITPEDRAAIKASPIYGVGIQASWRRYYPEGSLAGHITGFAGKDRSVRAGLELKYDKQLSGKQGRQVYIVDATRKPLAMIESTEMQNGSGLILTIDSTIQEFARTALIKQYEAYQAESATAIVMNPKTGAILAMVTVPDYDPGQYGSATADQLRNRAITDPFEPGSIFKPIVAAIALDNKSIGYNESIFCEKGSFYYGGRNIGEYGGHGYGNMTVRQILQKSSNIGMAKIGLKMGQKKLYAGVKMFGFGSRTGIDIPGEDFGLVWPLRGWTKLSVTRVPFGHELLVTAIQITRAYAILANGGRMVTPHIVRAVVDSEGNVIEKQPPVLGEYVIDPKTANWMVREALVDVVKEGGTGTNATLEKWQAFGKTGTADIARPAAQGGGYDNQNYVASFAGGAPAEDPQIVVLVSVYKPNKSLQKGYSGGRVAAPVFKEIAENTLNYLEQE